MAWSWVGGWGGGSGMGRGSSQGWADQHTAPPSLLSYFGTGKCVKTSTSVLVINTQSALETGLKTPQDALQNVEEGSRFRRHRGWKGGRCRSGDALGRADDVGRGALTGSRRAHHAPAQKDGCPTHQTRYAPGGDPVSHALYDFNNRALAQLALRGAWRQAR
jgi:hypothetical protein